MAGIPGDLADGQVGWGEVKNVPAGFADGVDDGVTKVTITQEYADYPTNLDPIGTAGETANSNADCPPGGRVVGGGFNTSGPGVIVHQSLALDSDTWTVTATNISGQTQALQAFAVCVTIEPAKAVATAKKSVKPANLKKIVRKRSR